jgi:hypothetical protein
LYPRRNTSSRNRSCAQVRNHSRLRHSSRNLPLKLSFVPFCQGFPGAMNAVSIPSRCSHPMTAIDTNSGPLSERNTRGAPRSLTSRLRTSSTRPERNRPAASIANTSRVHSSITVRRLIFWSFAQASKTKSYAQTWFAPAARCGRGRDEATRRYRRLRSTCSSVFFHNRCALFTLISKPLRASITRMR